MIAKLSLWLSLGLLVIALATSLVSLLCGAWHVLKFSAALSVFFWQAARMSQPAVEAYNNDRDWRELWPKQKL